MRLRQNLPMKIPATTTASKNDPRLEQARRWLQQLGVNPQPGFHPVAGDASFRRYFRLQIGGKSRILMDAPPPGDDLRPFLDRDQRLRSAELDAPEIIHADTQNGFLLLEDLGDDLYRGLLDENSADSLFPALFTVLKTMALTVDANNLPNYDRQLLQTEMNLFPNWYLGHHRKTMSRKRFDKIWAGFCEHIIDSALAQPRCFVHRDFHSCNLLKTGHDRIGVIDFQDAVNGPVSYDFISLVWDRYIQWPRRRIENWMEAFRLLLDHEIDPEDWQRQCDWMGLQRNIKIVGIFARLNYRDGKNGYIEMIPRFYDYVLDTLRRYPEFEPMLEILENPECAP